MKHIVFGLGAIGSNLLSQLVQIDPEGEFYGVDYDKVEERNLGTQAYLTPHVGMPKANAMQVILNMKKRGVKYTPKDIEMVNGMRVPDIIGPYNKNEVIIYDCFDNANSRRLLEGIENCLHIGFSPKYVAEIIWGFNYTSPHDIPEGELDICEMDNAVPFINFVVSMAVFSVQDYMQNGEENSYIITHKFKIRRM